MGICLSCKWSTDPDSPYFRRWIRWASRRSTVNLNFRPLDPENKISGFDFNRYKALSRPFRDELLHKLCPFPRLYLVDFQISLRGMSTLPRLPLPPRPVGTGRYQLLTAFIPTEKDCSPCFDAFLPASGRLKGNFRLYRIIGLLLRIIKRKTLKCVRYPYRKGFVKPSWMLDYESNVN